LLLVLIVTLAPTEDVQPLSLKNAPAPSLARFTVVLLVTFVAVPLASCVWIVMGPRHSFTAPLRVGVEKASFVGPAAITVNGALSPGVGGLTDTLALTTTPLSAFE
jgi:hypothetical protein